jgi:hypothetical protein
MTETDWNDTAANQGIKIFNKLSKVRRGKEKDSQYRFQSKCGLWLPEL